MDSCERDFKMARERLDRDLAITNEDLGRLEENVMACVRTQRKPGLSMKGIVGAFAALVVLAVGLPPALERAGGVAGVKERILSGIASLGQIAGREEPPVPQAVPEPQLGAYVIHDKAYYVPTEEIVPPEQVGAELGRVQRIGDWALKREGDSNAYPPQMNVYYVRNGADPKKEIVLLAKNNSADPGVYTVMRRAAVVAVDTSAILHAKNDQEEVGYVLENIRRLNPSFYEFRDVEDSLVLHLAAYVPDQKLVRMMYGVKGESGTITVYEYPRAYAGSSRESMHGPMYDDAGTAVTSEFEEAGLLWKRYKAVYVTRQEDTFYEVHIETQKTEDEVRRLLRYFVRTSR
ncbi:hypothetical protein OS242_05295 [Tumebacillus sp. DT12]|uniref:DUF4367 domain-containing protein n=1 Tax=Tumebacillus lacus TaxID=2995335 RepID=A0ABT3WXG3_9BACL|nr:hypothetical protein [Tumebacillus lacus]MCX7569368.1 hypothetical protein [Tumebacillus lacus]